MFNWGLISQIWVCLLLAAVFGGIIGWLLKKLSCDKAKEDYEGRLRTNEEEISRLRGSVSKAKGDASAENRKDDSEISALRAKIATLETDLKSSKDSYAKLETQSGEWKSKLAAFSDGAATSAVAGAVSAGGSSEKDAEITRLKADLANIVAKLRISRSDDLADESEINKLKTALNEAQKNNSKLQADLKAHASAPPKVVEKIVEKIVEKPVHMVKEKEKIVEKPVEVIKEVEVVKTVSNDAEWSAKYAKLEANLKTSNDKYAKLEAESSELKTKLAALTTGATKVASAGGNNDSEIIKLNAKIKSLEEDLRIAHDRQFTLEEDLKSSRSKSPSRGTSKKNKDGEKTSKVSKRKAKKGGEQGKEWDDLELINGVGPVLEKMLYDLGIYYFKDVASWDAAKVAEMDEKLPRFKGRIEREGWVESAKEEHFKKYGEKL